MGQGSEAQGSSGPYEDIAGGEGWGKAPVQEVVVDVGVARPEVRHDEDKTPGNDNLPGVAQNAKAALKTVHLEVDDRVAHARGDGYLEHESEWANY
jgi:hypothetical protein